MEKIIVKIIKTHAYRMHFKKSINIEQFSQYFA